MDLRALLSALREALRWVGSGCPSSVMEQAFDSLGAYRKLEESGMPDRQAGATVEVVKDSMQNFVTKEYFSAELERRFHAVDERFTKLEAKLDTSVAEFGKSQARGLVAMSAINIATASLLFAALQFFGVGATTGASSITEPVLPLPAFEAEATNSENVSSSEPR